MSSFSNGTIRTLIAVLLLNVAVVSFTVHHVGELGRDLDHELRRADERLRRLRHRAGFDAERRRLLGEIRREIREVNPSVGGGAAADYAELLIGASEKYPSVDPLMFLAIGIVESHYDPQAKSVADAKGLYQIWPSTGRRLARILGWDYADEMLYDPGHNTELAALYLDILLSTYNDPKMVFAEYNGGPLNAGYYRANSEQAARETVHYVAKVSSLYGDLKCRLAEGCPGPSPEDLDIPPGVVPTGLAASPAGN